MNRPLTSGGGYPIISCANAACSCHIKLCHSQEPQQEGWEKQVDDVVLVLARHLKSWDIELRRDIRNLIEKVRTEAYNLGKKEGHDDGYAHGLTMDFCNERVGFEKGIRSERERILAALPEAEIDIGMNKEIKVISPKIIHDLITNPQNRE